MVGLDFPTNSFFRPHKTAFHKVSLLNRKYLNICSRANVHFGFAYAQIALSVPKGKVSKNENNHEFLVVLFGIIILQIVLILDINVGLNKQFSETFV